MHLIPCIMRTNKPQILFCWWYQILLFLFRNFVCYNWINKNTIFCRSKKFNQKLFCFWFCCQQSIPLLDCISKNTITTKNKTQKWELELEHMAHFICVAQKRWFSIIKTWWRVKQCEERMHESSHSNILHDIWDHVMNVRKGRCLWF